MLQRAVRSDKKYDNTEPMQQRRKKGKVGKKYENKERKVDVA